MRVGDLDDDTTIYWTLKRRRIHLHPGCRVFDTTHRGVKSGPVESVAQDREVCKFCTGYKPGMAKQGAVALKLEQMSPEDLGL